MATFGLSFEVQDTLSSGISSAGSSTTIYTCPAGKFAVAYFKAYKFSGSETILNNNRIELGRSDVDANYTPGTAGFIYYTFQGSNIGAINVGIQSPQYMNPLGGSIHTGIDPTADYPINFGATNSSGTGIKKTVEQLMPIHMIEGDLLRLSKVSAGATVEVRFKIYEFS